MARRPPGTLDLVLPLNWALRQKDQTMRVKSVQSARPECSHPGPCESFQLGAVSLAKCGVRGDVK